MAQPKNLAANAFDGMSDRPLTGTESFDSVSARGGSAAVSAAPIRPHKPTRRDNGTGHVRRRNEEVARWA